jgi:hypothetical protein
MDFCFFIWAFRLITSGGLYALHGSLLQSLTHKLFYNTFFCRKKVFKKPPQTPTFAAIHTSCPAWLSSLKFAPFVDANRIQRISNI